MSTRIRHGRHTARIALAAIGTGLAIATSAQAAPTEALEATMGQTPAEQTIPVIATLNRQVDGESFEGRPQALLSALRRTADRTQPAVEQHVEGEVQNFWLINAVAFEGTPEEIRAVAADAAVASVDLDRPVVIDQARGSTLDGSTTADNWGLAATRVPQAWARFNTRGAGVRVGILDTGVVADHPALAGRIVAWRDVINGRPTPYDDNGHGTHAAGIIAGATANGTTVGVAPEAELVVAKAIAGDGRASGSFLLEAAQWMTDPDGNPATADQPHVVNNSWSSPGADDTWFRDIIQRWRDLNIVPIFAAGNHGPHIGSVASPAHYPDVIAVGALEPNGSVAPFSARGPGSWRDPAGLLPVTTKPDVTAPGVDIASTLGRAYGEMSGTSMAAPMVAGLAALVRQARPDLTVDGIADAIRAGATDIGAPGPDADTGHGRIDAIRTLEAVGAPGAPLPAASPDTAFATTPGAASTSRQVTYTVRLSGGATQVRVRINGGQWGAPSGTTTLRIALDGEGEHTVEAQGVAPDGSVDPSPARHVVRVDTIAPTLRVTHVRRGATSSLSAAASDVGSTTAPVIRWQFPNGDIVRGGAARRTFADDSLQTITVTAQDAAGNVTRRIIRHRPRAGVSLRGLRVAGQVSRRSGALRVSGSRVRSVPMRATLRPVFASAHSLPGLQPTVSAGAPVVRVSARASRGRFTIAMPLRSVRAGMYRVELRIPGASPIVRTVRVR